MSRLLTPQTLLPTCLNLLAIFSSTYHLRSHHIYNLQEQEARLDEIEGTLRGHIGLIEDALERIEGEKGKGEGGSGGREEKSRKEEELYQSRGRDEKGGGNGK